MVVMDVAITPYPHFTYQLKKKKKDMLMLEVRDVIGLLWMKQSCRWFDFSFIPIHCSLMMSVTENLQ